MSLAQLRPSVFALLLLTKKLFSGSFSGIHLTYNIILYSLHYAKVFWIFNSVCRKWKVRINHQSKVPNTIFLVALFHIFIQHIFMKITVIMFLELIWFSLVRQKFYTSLEAPTMCQYTAYIQNGQWARQGKGSALGYWWLFDVVLSCYWYYD